MYTASRSYKSGYPEQVTEEIAESTSIDQEIAQFWDRFRLFPRRGEDALFSKAGYLVCIALIPLFLLFLESLIFDLYFGTGFEQVRNLFTINYLPLHVISLSWILIIWPFVRWKQQVPVFFQEMLDNGRLGKVNESLMLDYLDFLRNYQCLLRSRYWVILLAAFIALVLGVNITLGVLGDLLQNQLLSDLFEWYSKLRILTLWIFSPLLWISFFIPAAWPIIITGLFVFRIPRQFEINIQPCHQDRCGGLKPVGNFCLEMTLPLILGGILLVVIAVIYIIWSGNILHPISQAVYLTIFILLLPLTAASFFLPTWSFHQAMVEYKRAEESKITSRMLELDECFRSLLEGEVDIEDAKTAKEELEVLKTIHPDQMKYPVWPFRVNVLWGIFAPQLLALAVNFLSQLITDWITKQ